MNHSVHAILFTAAMFALCLTLVTMWQASRTYETVLWLISRVSRRKQQSQSDGFDDLFDVTEEHEPLSVAPEATPEDIYLDALYERKKNDGI